MSQEPTHKRSRPSHYIDRISLATGAIIKQLIAPEELLIRHHRDYHIVETYARPLLSILVKATGDEQQAWRALHKVRNFGTWAAQTMARAIGSKDPQKISRLLFGVRPKTQVFRYKVHQLPHEEVQSRLKLLQEQARAQLERTPRWQILLTGGTGFVGKELIWQASQMPQVSDLFVVIRPRAIKDRKTGQILKIMSPAERGEELLRELRLNAQATGVDFHFVEGDIEQPDLGISSTTLESLKPRLTHVLHCAASVAFDDSYEDSFRANVLGSLNALKLSLKMQQAPGSPFVAHLAIETAYMHGRQMGQQAREEEIVFPSHYYNNFYELTKALAAWETERFMLDKRLRVIQLCPSIVIGDHSGNNRGDLKVVNGPVNAFGRARQALLETRKGWLKRFEMGLLYQLARIFPGDPSAQLNLIPVDWVCRGILSSLNRPQSVGASIHLATDQRVNFRQMQKIIQEELEVDVKLVDPTIHRNLLLPLLTRLLALVNQSRLAAAAQRLATTFGGYCEWGQPIHAVGLDVQLLEMPAERPAAHHTFRMLCRHNRFVQEFGRCRDPLEISRREQVWSRVVERIEAETGRPAAAMAARDFRTALGKHLNAQEFALKEYS